MPLRLIRHSKRHLLSLTIITYCLTIVTIFIWSERLKPNMPAKVEQIILNKHEGTLNVIGENLPANFSAILTLNMQRQQSTVSSCFTWGQVNNATSFDNHLWIANGPNGVLSYNTLNPNQPILEGTLAFENGFRAWNITTGNDIALVAGGSTGLAGIDISRPESPEVKFTLYGNKFIFDSIIKDDTAIILTARDGVLVLDISNMFEPKEIGELTIEGVLSTMTLIGDKVFVCGKKDDKGQLYILDITQPRQPKIVASIVLPHPVHHLKKVDNALLISMGKHGLYIADINTINQTPPPHRIEEIAAYGLCTVNQDVFISNGAHHIHHYRFNNGVLTLIKTFATEGKCHNIFMFNNYIVACLGKKGFALFDPSKENVTPPASISFNNTYRNSPNMIHKNGLTIIHSDQTTNLFTTTAEGIITQYDSITFPSPINDIAMGDKYAFIALKNREIHTITLQQGASKRTKAVIPWFENIDDIDINGSNLYLGIKKLGIFIFNKDQLTEPSNTTPAIAITYGHYDIKDDLLYVATNPNGLNIYRIRDDAVPSLIGELQYPAAAAESSDTVDLVHKDGFVFMANRERGLLSIDVRNPEKPVISDALSVNGRSSRLTIEGDYAYVTNDRYQVTVVDINDPLKMKILCALPLTSAVAVADNKIYQLSDLGVYINSTPRPLKITKKRAHSMGFQLPPVANEGYYDLQLATTQDITKHSDLLHYSQQQGWTITREAKFTDR